MNAAEQGSQLGLEIVRAHGGKTGEQLALAMADPARAGRLVGQRIVDQHGGKTGDQLVLALTA